MQVLLYHELAELPHFNPDLDPKGSVPPPAVARLRALVTKSTGILISTPEYAHGLPGSFKNALDWLVSYPDFAGKPVAIFKASPHSGAHAQASLIEILKTMSARLLPQACLQAPSPTPK